MNFAKNRSRSEFEQEQKQGTNLRSKNAVGGSGSEQQLYVYRTQKKHIKSCNITVSDKANRNSSFAASAEPINIYYGL